MGLYKIKTISELSGFSPELLRAWERRYRLLAPVRTPTGHRLYTEADVEVLAEVRRQLEEGRSIGEVASAGRDRLLRRVPAGPLDNLRERALQCALELDGVGLEQVLDQAFALVGPAQVLEDLILPSARQMGNLWSTGAASVAAEHLQSSVYSRRLEALCRAALSFTSGHPTYVVCCLQGEHHELAARLVAYYVAGAGAFPLYLGADLPLVDLERVCREQRPAAALLSVTREATLLAQVPALRALAQRLDTPLLVGGAGVAGHEEGLASAGLGCWPAARPLRELGAWLRAR